jgi:hypothetical protein
MAAYDVASTIHQSLSAGAGAHILTLEVGDTEGVSVEIDTVELYRFMTLDFDGRDWGTVLAMSSNAFLILVLDPRRD